MKKQISNKNIFLLCFGDFSRGLLYGIITTYLLSFFVPTTATSTLPRFLVSAGLAMAAIRSIGMVIDAITDPWFANISDKFHGKHGRRIPFMKWSAIPYALCCLLIFFPPINGSSFVNVVWVGLMLVAYYVFSTFYNIPYMALQAEIVTEPKRRVFLYTITSLMFVVGSALVYTTGLFKGLLMGAGLSELWGFRIPFCIFAVIGCITALIPAFVIKENDYVEPQQSYMPILKSLKATFKYKNFAIMTIGYLIMWVAFAFFNASLVYYIENLLGQPSSFSTIVLGISIVVGIATYPLLNKVAKKTGKKPLLLGACVAYIFIYGCIYFYQPIVAAIGGNVFAILLGVFIAFPIAVTNIVPSSTFADLAQYDHIKTGENRAGMFVAARNFASKMAQSIVLLIVPSLLLIGSPDGNTAGSRGIQLTALVACIFVGGALITYIFYNDKEVIRTINEHNALEEAKKK